MKIICLVLFLVGISFVSSNPPRPLVSETFQAKIFYEANRISQDLSGPGNIYIY